MQNKAEEISLDQLNDDCLECIFQRLQELPAQVQAARTCKRFRDINARIWRRNNVYHTFCLEEWRQLLIQHEDLRCFVNVMQDYIESIRISEQCLNAFLQDLEDLGMKWLPSVKRLDVEWIGCYPQDEDIEALSVLLPNLRYLKLTAPISGRYLTNFTKLEELHLYEDQEKEYEMHPEYLHAICEQLRDLRVLDMRAYELSTLVPTHIAECQNLEVLRLNLSALKPVLAQVLQLPRLKTLTVLLDMVIDVSRIENVDTHDYKIYETAEFYEICATKSDKISGLAIDNYFMPFTPHWDERLSFWRSGKLLKFAFCNCEFETTEFLEKYARLSPQLQLVCLRHCSELINATVLMFVALCPQLRHLDISYCQRLDKSLLYDVLDILKHEQSQRSQPLCIYYLRSGLENEIEKANPSFWRAQNLIKLYTDFPPNSDIGLSYVQQGFEFDFA